MYLLSFFSVAATMMILAVAVQADEPHTIRNVVLAIHGGAGPLPREKFKADPALAGRYKEVLKQALAAGQKALHHKDNSLDGVEAAVRVLEDSPLFNAGKGAVFTHDGRNELDAAIMDGKRRAGAVAGITRIRNPIAAARAVMEKSEHVMLVGEGADRFAIHQGLEEVSPVYFWTEHRWKQLQQAIQKEEQHQRTGKAGPLAVSEFAFGTVGAVVLWKDELAAGTSTGGMTNKRPGRVGDSPIIGAGTYAENGACAVSATGHGEVFICHTVAHDLAARMKYLHEPIGKAAADILAEMPKEKDGVGGLIALDSKGNLTMPFNSTGMFRGYATAGGKIYVAIFED